MLYLYASAKVYKRKRNSGEVERNGECSDTDDLVCFSQVSAVRSIRQSPASESVHMHNNRQERRMLSH